MEMVDTRAFTPKQVRKTNSYERTIDYFTKYRNFLVMDLTNISSRQLQNIRYDLRGKAAFLFGKNTTIRLALRKHIEDHPELQGVLDVIKDNVGIAFTSGDLKDICDVLESRKVSSVARPGNLSQCDLWIEPICTGLDPGKTSFFQALGIATKITKGKIEILTKCKALTKGKRVGPSEAALLGLLGITPFVYKMEVVYAYADGKFFDVKYLSMTQDDVLDLFRASIAEAGAMALGAGYVTESTVAQELAQGVKETCAIALAIDYEMKELAAMLAGAAQPSQPASAQAPAAQAAQPEPEEEEEEDFDLF